MVVAGSATASFAHHTPEKEVPDVAVLAQHTRPQHYQGSGARDSDGYLAFITSASITTKPD
jgi:hypothetical protein